MLYSSAGGRWVIVATVLGSAMASIDATVVGIAVPSIGRDLHASLGALQWVVTGYTLSLAALLLPAGALGDQLGRRRVFDLGVMGFALMSALCAVAPGVTFLIVVRILQGIAAALLIPGSLAIIEASFDERSRGQAVGAWSGLGGVATAAGPLLGGYLITAVSWRWIFVINVPIGALVLWLSRRHVPESRDIAAPPGVDVYGSVLAISGLAGLTYGLIEGPATGWKPAVVVVLLLGVAALGGFVWVESSVGHPMLPLSLLGQRQFVVTNVVTFIVYAALGGMLFLIPVQLQVVDGYSALGAGLSLLPVTLIMLVLSAPAGRVSAQIGPRVPMAVGPVIVGAGLALLRRASADHAYVSGVLPAMIVFGLGLGVTVAPLTATVLASLPEERAGLASAVNNDASRLGGLLAVAVLPAVAGLAGEGYLRPAAVAAGFETATTVAALLCVLGGIVAAVGIRNPERVAPAPEATGEAKPPVKGIPHCALDGAPLVRDDMAGGSRPG